MKELTNEQRKDLWSKYVHYQWEITRRNKDYQSEYEDLKNTLDEETMHSKRMAMAIKWGFAVDPRNEEPYLAEMGSGISGNIKIIKSPVLDCIVDEGLMTIVGKGSDPNLIDNEIIVSIDVSGPDWLTIASLESILKSIRMVTDIKEKRISWDNLDDYLQVYDLSQCGFSPEDIAKELFLYNIDDIENDIEQQKESAARKVRRYLKKAIDFIENGQIR